MPLSKIVQSSVDTPVAGTGPALWAATGYTVSVTNNTVTAGTSYGSPTIDTTSAFNTTTGRFTPQVAGYYQANAIADFGANGIGTCSSVGGIVLKNGATYAGAGANVNGSSFAGYIVTTLVYLNGSTDYIQAGIFQNTGGTVSGARVILNACLVRAA